MARNRGPSSKKQVATSRVTTKFQATIPVAARKALGIARGDTVAFEVEDDRVLLRRVRRVDVEYLEAVSAGMSEWASDADDEAYRDL